LVKFIPKIGKTQDPVFGIVEGDVEILGRDQFRDDALDEMEKLIQVEAELAASEIL